MTDTCEKCGRVLEVGMYPFCPHSTGTQQIISDEVPGGFVVENGFSTPTRFDTKSEHRAALAARGLEICAKPKRQESFVDAETLAWAARRLAEARSIPSTDTGPEVPVEFFERVRPDLALVMRQER